MISDRIKGLGELSASGAPRSLPADGSYLTAARLIANSSLDVETVMVRSAIRKPCMRQQTTHCKESAAITQLLSNFFPSQMTEFDDATYHALLSRLFQNAFASETLKSWGHSGVGITIHGFFACITAKCRYSVDKFNPCITTTVSIGLCVRLRQRTGRGLGPIVIETSIYRKRLFSTVHKSSMRRPTLPRFQPCLPRPC